MPLVSSILAHTNPTAAAVDSDNIRGGFRTSIDTAANLAALYDPDAALQSSGNYLDVAKAYGTVTYVTADSKYYILEDTSQSDIEPGTGGSGWVDFRVALGAAAEADLPTFGIADTNAVKIDASAGSSEGVVETGNFPQFTASGLKGLTAGEMLSVIGAQASGSYQASGNYITGTGSLSPADVTNIGNLSGTNSGDESDATTTAVGVVELATNGEANAGTTSGTVGKLVVTPGNLQGFTGSSSITKVGTINNLVDGTQAAVWNGAVIDSNYLDSDIAYTSTNVVFGSVGVGNSSVAADLSVSGDAHIFGDLFVTGNVTAIESGTVSYVDSVLLLNLDSSITDPTVLPAAGNDTPSSGTAGIEAYFGVKAETGSGVGDQELYKTPQFVYEYTSTKWKATSYPHGSPATSAAQFDNAALVFDATDTLTQNDNGDDTTITASNICNATSVRHLGQVATCPLIITTEDEDTSANFAPQTAGAVGYPITHNLNTSSVVVFALKTGDAGASSTTTLTAEDRQAITPKYHVIDDDSIRVSVGVTAEFETYDIIVIG